MWCRYRLFNKQTITSPRALCNCYRPIIEDIKKINDTQDVKGIKKSYFPSVLENAGAKDADMIIAVTRNDETNMIVCQIASSLFNISKKLHAQSQEFRR